MDRVACTQCGKAYHPASLLRHLKEVHGGARRGLADKPKQATAAALAPLPQSDEGRDLSLSGMVQVMEALKPLNATERRRVLDAVTLLYGIER